MFDGDPLLALDARIAALRDARAGVPRFSEAYWQTDDALAWLRMVRDELARTGHLRDDVMALLELPMTSLLAVAADLELAPFRTAAAATAVAGATAIRTTDAPGADDPGADDVPRLDGPLFGAVRVILAPHGDGGPDSTAAAA